MYTNIPWGDDNKGHKSKGRSFVFRVNDDYSIRKFNHDNKSHEVHHSNLKAFCMDNLYGPYAIDFYGKTDAYLGNSYKIS